MKNTRNIIILTSLLSLTAFSGCSKTSSDNTPNEPERVAPESISFDWQKPYESIIKDFQSSEDCSENSAFDLVDLDGDHSPELIISPSTEPKAVCRIYTCKSGTSSELGELCKGGKVVWLPEMELYKDEYQGESFTIGSYLSLENGEFTEKLNYYTSNNISSVKHTINGDELLLPDYEEKLKPYNDAYTVVYGRKYGFGENAVKTALYRSESWGAVITSAERDAYRGKLNEYLEACESSGEDAAFELFDVNNDNIPELVISQGSSESSKCLIYSISEGNIAVSDPIGYAGAVSYDFAQNIMFYQTEENKYACASLSDEPIDSNITVDSLTDRAEFGRRYPLTAENIQLALN